MCIYIYIYVYTLISYADRHVPRRQRLLLQVLGLLDDASRRRCTYIYIYIYTCVYVYIYIYIYIRGGRSARLYRERGRGPFVCCSVAFVYLVCYSSCHLQLLLIVLCLFSFLMYSLIILCLYYNYCLHLHVTFIDVSFLLFSFAEGHSLGSPPVPLERTETRLSHIYTYIYIYIYMLVIYL